MNNFGNLKVKPRRGFVLWILAIFAMIQAGSNGTTDLIFAIIPDIAARSIESLQALPMFSSSEYTEAFNLMLSIKSWQYLLLLLTEVASFTGAFLMLVKLNPLGFHIYTIGQICQILIMNFVIGGKASMTMSSILMVILIVVMFATQLPFMKHEDDEDESMEEKEDFDADAEDSKNSDTEV